MPQTLPPKLLEPFRGQIQQRHDMGGMHLVLPVDLRPLRSGLWSLLLLSVGLTGFGILHHPADGWQCKLQLAAESSGPASCVIASAN